MKRPTYTRKEYQIDRRAHKRMADRAAHGVIPHRPLRYEDRVPFDPATLPVPPTEAQVLAEQVADRLDDVQTQLGDIEHATTQQDTAALMVALQEMADATDAAAAQRVLAAEQRIARKIEANAEAERIRRAGPFTTKMERLPDPNDRFASIVRATIHNDADGSERVFNIPQKQKGKRK